MAVTREKTKKDLLSAHKNLHIPSHPLLAHKLTVLRDRNTQPKEFRSVLKDITFYLGYEGTTDLNLIAKDVTTPMTGFKGKEVSEMVALIPILRAGLGMVDAMMDLVPKAVVYHIGMYRHKHSLLPIEYYRRLPKKCDSNVAIVLEPIIATSGTVNAVVSTLKTWGVKKIKVLCVLASEEGISRFCQDHPDVEVLVGDVDKFLSEEGQIIPGLGDAGDRLFRTIYTDSVDPDEVKRQKIE